MSLLASVLPGKQHPQNGPAANGAPTGPGTNSRYITPTIKPAQDAIGTLQFQQNQSGSNANGDSRSVMSQRFLLPQALDSAGEVSYKISVPNFENLPPLKLGSKFITDLIRIDSMTPGDTYGDAYLNKGNNNLDNYFFDKENGLGHFSRFEKVSQLDLPDKFFEETNLTECSMNMGLMPEINRSWIAVDNKLVFWNYKLPQSSFNKSSQFLTIDQIRHSILTVKLVKSKPGVFVKEVNYLLLIATTMDIHIYVVKYDESLNNLEVFNPNLSVNVQGLMINKFAFNELTHEIYFSGESDGVNVWKLEYHSNASFIKNRCDKVCLTKSGLSSVLPIGKMRGFDLFHSEHESHNKTGTSDGNKASSIPESISELSVDGERKVLYTLSNKSIIRVYKLTPDQKEFSQHSQFTPAEFFRAVSSLYSNHANIKSFSKFRIVSIQPVSTKESNSVSLIATTNYGFRILLRIGSAGHYASFMSTTSRFASNLKLSLVSVKFPPSDEVTKMNPELDQFTRIKSYVATMVTNQQNSELLKNTKFSKIISPGVYLAVKRTKGSDKLFVSSTNYGYLKRNNKLVEDAEFLKVASQVESKDGSPIYIHDIVQLTPSMNATETPNGYANVLASQYTKKPLQFAVLTNYGILMYQYRTSDQIISSLKDEVLENFIEENGYEETCSTLLYLSCSPGYLNGKDLFHRTASMLFSHAGSNARLSENASTVSGGPSHLPLQPSDSKRMVEQVVLSDRFYGTCLLISRLFRDFWNKKVFTPLPHIKMLNDSSVEVSSLKEGNLIVKGLTMSKSQVEFYIGSVFVLLEFFNENSNDIPGLNAPSYSSDPTKMENEVCMRAEHIAFTSIVRSLNSMKEALSFLMVLIEETQSDQKNFNDIFQFLSLTNQVNFLTLTFKDLLLPTQEVKGLIKDLLSSIINKNILKGGSIDSIASSLQGRCGSFCSSDDVYIFKAIENLTKAKNIGNRDSELKVKCLNNAISLFEQAVDSLTLENIENALNIMLTLEFYTGAVQFVLKLAKKCYSVTNTQSSTLITNGDNKVDNFKNQLEINNKKRMQLYDLVFKILTRLDVNALKIEESNNQLLLREFMDVRDATYETCFASTDQKFHNEFYQWFINQGNSQRLLSIETPYILPFLEEVSQKDLGLTQLLWLYHARRENYFAAARILYSLAISDFIIPLNERIEYLSRANGFCNCTCPPNLRQEMIHLSNLVHELFNVANVQLNLLKMIQNDKRINGENKKIASDALNNKIQSASDLFNEYADPLGYYEICFAIFKVSDYKNPDEIFKRWEFFFEKIFHEYMTDKSNDAPLYKMISDKIVPVGVSLAPNDLVFPVDRLIKMVCKYIQNAIEEDSVAQTPPEGAVVEMLLKSQISYEKLYVVIKSLIEHNAYDVHSGFTQYLKKSEMVYLIRKWYNNDKKLKDAVDGEQIAGMTEYSVEKDPVDKWVQLHKTFI
ncbi:hypothetical protein CA3LBN_003649 [Candidozyma haemuli]|uniref:Nucleoporin n=1 Tax=Candidozyma haemuli TaxID=45357 RepID=A0ABX8I7R9_9ASCO|nr:hypothetical protein CA3LBN_003649 [[Candida] haemuloni]